MKYPNYDVIFYSVINQTFDILVFRAGVAGRFLTFLASVDERFGLGVAERFGFKFGFAFFFTFRVPHVGVADLLPLFAGDVATFLLAFVLPKLTHGADWRLALAVAAIFLLRDLDTLGLKSPKLARLGGRDLRCGLAGRDPGGLFKGFSSFFGLNLTPSSRIS